MKFALRYSAFLALGIAAVVHQNGSLLASSFWPTVLIFLGLFMFAVGLTLLWMYCEIRSETQCGEPESLPAPPTVAPAPAQPAAHSMEPATSPISAH